MTNRCIRHSGLLLAICALAAVSAQQALAAVLKPETTAAFNRYVELTESRMAADAKDGRFLVLDTLPDERRSNAYDSVRQGQVYVIPLRTFDEGQKINVPSGMIHHWVGIVFIPGATISQVADVVTDYSDQAKFYSPEVEASKPLARTSDEVQVFLRLRDKSVVTVVYNGNFDIRNRQLDRTRMYSRSYSTRIAEVADPGTPNEHELPVGRDHGYMWRLYSYWRIQEKDGGTYVQIETVELSRSVPPEFLWLVGPLLESIPRRTLTNLLTATRRAVLGQIAPK